MSSDDEMYYDSDEGSDIQEDEEMLDASDAPDSDSSPDDGDMSDEDFPFETEPIKTKAKLKPYEVEYESLSVGDIEGTMKKDAEHISGIFGVGLSTAYILLRHESWNKERLIERYMDDPSKVLSAAGVVDPDAPAPLPKAAPPPTLLPVASSSGTSMRRSLRRLGSSKARSPSPAPPTPSVATFTCPICCDDDPEATLALGCGHTYCSNCWQTYLHTKIHDEGECAIRCMDEECRIQADDAFVRNAAAPEDISRYGELLVRDFVASSSKLVFCPHPGCQHALSCAAASMKGALSTIVPNVLCSDKHEFCFGCGLEGGHRPVICSVSRMWLKKCADDSETANWIKSNTKECTKCHSTIEKNGGCNHMTCKKCKHEFCWVCMGNWSEHGQAWYTCNRYDEKDGVDARDAQSRSRASLERYLHYYNRWANHEQSAKLSLDLYAKTEKKMEEMQVTSNLTWIEVQFAKKAVDEVLRCRHTLKWTYSMAYYLERGNMKQLFEDNQADLESAVEALSELLEQPIEPETISELRQKMTDKTVYVAKRNEIVLQDTAAGFAEGRWQWNVPSLP